MPRAKRAMTVSRTARGDIITVFKSLLERRFSEAERALNAVREKRFGNSEFKGGYLNALEGIILSLRSGDERDFVNRAPFDDDSMKRYRREFRAFLKEGVHTPFDTGYFSAWSDFMYYRLNSTKKKD